MDLVSLLVVLIIFGVCFWLVNHVIPIEPPVLKTIILVILAIILIGVLLGYIPVGHLRIER